MTDQPMTDEELAQEIEDAGNQVLWGNPHALCCAAEAVLRIGARLDAEIAARKAAEAEADLWRTRAAGAVSKLPDDMRLGDLQEAVAEMEKIKAQRDAALARAMPDWRPIETAPHGEKVLLYCPDRGPTNPERIELGYASSGTRNAVSSNISLHSWATLWRPLPDLPIPTTSEEG